MACGCKNKPVPNTQQVQEMNQRNQETIMSSIKKTVEKYYYNDKKSNGWVK